MSKIAFCILTHYFNPILSAFIKQMNSENSYFFIHVDSKTEIQSYSSLFNYENISFISKRVNVTWGQYSLIQSMLNLLEATKVKDIDHVFFVSGETLPLMSLQEIQNHLASKIDQEFLQISPINDFVINRLKWIYPDNTVYKSPIKRIDQKIKNKYNKHKTNPYFNTLPPLYFGSAWIGITQTCRDFILNYLNDNPIYIKAFKKAFCGDEIFFHTIIMNFFLKRNINTQGAMYVDWSTNGASPKTLCDLDLNAILQIQKNIPSPYIFARKFSANTDLALYERIFIKSF